MNARLIATRLLALATLGGVPPHPVQPAPAAPARPPDLIPREVLFPPAEAMQSIQLSPDGATLFHLAPDAAGVLQPWLSSLDGSARGRCPALAPPGASSPIWAPDARSILYQHREGTRQRLLACDVKTGEARELLALDAARIDKVMSSPRVPGELLLALRLRDDAEAEVHRLDLASGRRTLDTGNPGGVPGPNFHADVELRVLAASRTVANGSTEVLVRDAVDAPWRVGFTADGTHSLAIDAISGDGRFLLLRSDLASDMARLVEWPLAGGRERAIAGRRDLDVENVLLHPQTRAVQAVSFLTDPRSWRVLDSSLRADFAQLRKLLGPGQLAIGSRDLADSRWLVWHRGDRRGARCLLWDRATRTGKPIFEAQPELASLPLAPVQAIAVKSRDGLVLRCYLRLPVGAPRERLPLVVWVHGGPYLRDSWGYDNIGQFFVNRDYAFLRVNFRGSRGFGRAFRVASHKEWGGRMQDDVVDATRWAVARGIADPRRIAIIGHSYGGYAALVGLTSTPELFACGAASSTVADLVAFARHFPRTPDNAWVPRTVGDMADVRDLARLRSVSPLNHVERLAKPFVLARGDKDGVLPPGEAEAFVEALESRGKSMSYVVYEGDGHFFSRANQLDYMARVETLFAHCLGGRAERPASGPAPGCTALVRNLRMPESAVP